MAQTNALTGCWDMFKRGAQRHLKPGIFIELAPTGEGKAPLGFSAVLRSNLRSRDFGHIWLFGAVAKLPKRGR